MKRLTLHQQCLRLRLQLIVAIDRGTLADSERVRELFEEWQRARAQLQKLEAKEKKIR